MTARNHRRDWARRNRRQLRRWADGGWLIEFHGRIDPYRLLLGARHPLVKRVHHRQARIRRSRQGRKR